MPNDTEDDILEQFRELPFERRVELISEMARSLTEEKEERETAAKKNTGLTKPWTGTGPTFPGPAWPCPPWTGTGPTFPSPVPEEGPISPLSIREFHSAYLRQKVREMDDIGLGDRNLMKARLSQLEEDGLIEESERKQVDRIVELVTTDSVELSDMREDIREIYYDMIDDGASSIAIGIAGVALSSAEFLDTPEGRTVLSKKEKDDKDGKETVKADVATGIGGAGAGGSAFGPWGALGGLILGAAAGSVAEWWSQDDDDGEEEKDE